MNLNRQTAPTGTLYTRQPLPLKTSFSLREVMRWAYPQKGLAPEINAWREQNWPKHVRPVALQLKAAATLRGLLGPEVRAYSQLHITKLSKDRRQVFGLGSLRVVTTVGVGFIVDAWQNSVELEIMKYHGVGTGTNAEAVGDTALQTESTTVLLVDNTRATGSLTEGASANIFRTVGTQTFDGAAAITEHGIFSQAATGGGVLLDRSVFAAINVVSGDSIQFTYDLTLTAGS